MRRLRMLSICLCFFGLTGVAVSLAARETEATERRVLGVIEDFSDIASGPYQKGSLESWRWNDAFRARAQKGSRLEVAANRPGTGKSLRVRVDDPTLLAGDALPVLRLAPYFPPEADAVRIRLRVDSGQAVVFVGGPTAYYANSDVFSEPQTFVATENSGWIEAVFNFNHPTWRNFRRSGFSTEAPRNYYNRWAQEPLGVYVADGTRGEFSIDRIELLALGEGKPFAEFRAEQIRPLATIADFEDGRLDGTFNLYMADAESEWFEQSWKRERPLRFAPMQLVIAAGRSHATRSLSCTGRTAEEVHCTGVQTHGDARANAFAVDIAVDAAEQRNTLVGVGPTVPIDFLVFTAPAKRPFPWQHFAPSAELRAHEGPGFDYQFSYRKIREYADVDFAIYQTRRYLAPDEWTRLVLPAADFTCIYGHGAYRRRFVDHQPLTCSDVVAVAWIRPWCRAGRRDSTVDTRIDTLSFVAVPGSAAEHRSFWQVSDVKQLRYRKETSARGRLLHVALPDDEF